MNRDADFRIGRLSRKQMLGGFGALMLAGLGFVQVLQISSATAEPRDHPGNPASATHLSPSGRAGEHVSLTAAELKWQPGPDSLPPGVQMAVLSGDPRASGPFTIRFKAPAGYKIPPHRHPADENVTVISGRFHMGMGDTFDEAKAKALPVGSFSMMPAGVHHFAFTSEETIVQVHGIGPWGIIYLNPADDPRRR